METHTRRSAARYAVAAVQTCFLNVDLDVWSRRDLRPLADALGNRVCVLYLGPENGRYSAHLEIAAPVRNTDATIRAFCRMLASLPPAGREAWDSADIRSFSIGVRAGFRPPSRDFTVEPKTLKAGAALDAGIVFAVYSPGGPQK